MVKKWNGYKILIEECNNSFPITIDVRIYPSNANLKNYEVRYSEILSEGHLLLYPTIRKADLVGGYTEKDHRRKGLNTKVMELLISESKKRGIDNIRIATKNPEIKKMAEKFGFKILEETTTWKMELIENV